MGPFVTRQAGRQAAERTMRIVSGTIHPTPLEWLSVRDVPDVFFPIQPEPDFAGFGMTNPAGARTGFSNLP